MNNESLVQDAFSKLVSGGKAGYKTVIDKTPRKINCGNCNHMLTGDEKFCPECGNKISKEENYEKKESTENKKDYKDLTNLNN